MADILQDLPIKADPDRVFEAISTPEGLNRWWTLYSAGKPVPGAEYELWFGHDVGWRAMRLGRRIERMQFIAQMLARHLARPEAARPEAVEWLLDVCDSTPIYHAKYLGAPRLSSMLSLLLHDE